MGEEEDLVEQKPRGRTALKIVIASVVLVFLLGGLVLNAALRRTVAFPFLNNARVLHNEEWIEGTSGWGRLKTNGTFRLPGSIETVTDTVRKDLHPPAWGETVKPSTVMFQRENQYVTLQDRPSDGEVTIVIQTYRTPSMLDRIRLWYNHTFKKSSANFTP